MKDAYKVDIIDKHLKAQAEDEYYFAQVTGSAGKNINLDKGALLLLKKYYEDTMTEQATEELLAEIERRHQPNLKEGPVQPLTVRELFYMLGEEIHKGNTDKIVYIGGAHRLNDGEAKFLSGNELKTLAMFKNKTDKERENIVCLK